MIDFAERITKLRLRPGMFLLTNELKEATAFVCGMDLMQEEPVGNKFGEWIKKTKLKRRSPMCWPVLVAEYLDEQNVNPEDRINEFLSLLVEYLEVPS